MKTKEELSALKEKIDNIREDLKELSPEELKEVTGGIGGLDDVVFTDPQDLSDDTRRKANVLE